MMMICYRMVFMSHLKSRKDVTFGWFSARQSSSAPWRAKGSHTLQQKACLLGERWKCRLLWNPLDLSLQVGVFLWFRSVSQHRSKYGMTAFLTWFCTFSDGWLDFQSMFNFNVRSFWVEHKCELRTLTNVVLHPCLFRLQQEDEAP